MAQTKIRNPFLHTHDHDHDHAHGDGHHHHDHDDHDPHDPAQQSLADALRVSFGLLKWVMAILVVVYLFTGVFSVSPQERAVRLRFGKLVGAEGQQVYGPGWHFGLPYPIEQYLRIPVSQRTIDLNRAFWFSPPPGSEGQTLDQLRGGPLNPERDGSLITGDANIVHGQFRVTYHIDDPAAFVRNVGDTAVLESIVRNVAERAILHAVAQTEADEFIRSNFNEPMVREQMRQSLETLDVGVVVDGVMLTRPTAPLPVQQAYQQVNDAESEKAQRIEEARQRATSTLNETAGEGYDELLALVGAYELARAVNNEADAERLLAQIDASLDRLEVASETDGVARIGGQVATVINGAHTESTTHVQQVRGDADYFQQMLRRYREAPELVLSRLSQEARRSILTGDVETLYAASGEGQRLVITTNRDPNLKQQRERERLLQQQQQAREQAQRQGR